MAGLQERNGSFRAIFRYLGKQRSVTLGKVSQQEAEAKAGAIDLLLLRIKQGLLVVPNGVTIEEFVLSEGEARAAGRDLEVGEEAKPDEPVKLSAFKEKYLEARSGGSMEANSLATARMHLGHFERTLGADFDLGKLTLADLQAHINKRRKDGDPRRKTPRDKPISAATLRLEVSALRAAWGWASLNGLVKGAFPSKGLQYPKADEQSPFMTWQEIERRVRTGGSSDLWDSSSFARKRSPSFWPTSRTRQRHRGSIHWSQQRPTPERGEVNCCGWRWRTSTSRGPRSSFGRRSDHDGSGRPGGCR